MFHKPLPDGSGFFHETSDGTWAVSPRDARL